METRVLIQPFPHHNDASYKIWTRLANWPQRHSSFIRNMTEWHGKSSIAPLFQSGAIKTLFWWCMLNKTLFAMKRQFLSRRVAKKTMESSDVSWRQNMRLHGTWYFTVIGPTSVTKDFLVTPNSHKRSCIPLPDCSKGHNSNLTWANDTTAV